MATKMVFINLPVTDLQRSIAFYQALGFTQNKDFSDENASSLMWSETIGLMVLTHNFYEKFLQGKTIADTKKNNSTMIALTFDSAEAVQQFADTAVANGGQSYVVDTGIPITEMVEIQVLDPDGNHLSACWMNGY